jgi:hypothetical protein
VITLAVFAAVITVLYAVSALARILPVKRRHHSWKNVASMSVASVAVVALAGSAYMGLNTSEKAGPSYPVNTADPVTQTTYHKLPMGVFTGPQEGSSWSSVGSFSSQIGQQVRYVLDYLGPAQPFPAQLGREAAAHHAEPVLQLEPTMSMADVAAGHDNGYLKSLAAQVRAYHHPVVLSWAPEANGNWYSYGWTHTPPGEYRAAWKTVLSQFSGTGNVTWMDTLNINYNGSAPISDYIVPGVGMIGIDGYIGAQGETYSSMIQPTINQVRKATSKPVMLSETSVDQAYQAQVIPSLAQGARNDHLAGLIWFNQNQEGGQYHQHWQLTPAGAAALRTSLKPGPSTIPVLLYHGIYGPGDPQSNSVSLSAFRQQMADLHHSGYHTISPAQYQQWAQGDAVSLPPHPILITVDCNQASFLRALPVLRQYQYRVVMYVVTGFADGGYNGPQAQPGSSYYIDWDQLKAIYKDGYIYPQFHAGQCGHGYTMASSPYGCADGLTPTPGTIWGHRYYSDPMGQSAGAYHARVNKEIQQGLATMHSELGLSGQQLSETFAVPFSDYGQSQTSNEPWLGPYFGSQFKVVFVQTPNSADNGTVGTQNRQPRFEVDENTPMSAFTGALNNSQFGVREA